MVQMIIVSLPSVKINLYKWQVVVLRFDGHQDEHLVLIVLMADPWL